MKSFQFVEPRTLDEALRELDSGPGGGRLILAGGTDLIPLMRRGVLAPDVLIDITKLELDRVEECGDGVLIGAACTFRHLAHAPALRRFPALVQASGAVGALQTRGLATIGGNICSAVPSMDSGPALIALGARLRLAGRSGEREIPFVEFCTGPRRTQLREGEILTHILIPTPPAGLRSRFLKFGRRNALTLSIANAAVGGCVENGRLRDVRLGVGACAPTPVKLAEAERYLEGKPCVEIDWDRLDEMVREALQPISDLRASAEYRLDLGAALVRKLIRFLFGIEEGANG